MATAQSLWLQEPRLTRTSHLLYNSPNFPAVAFFVHINKICRSFKKLNLKCFLPNNNRSSGNNGCRSAADQHNISKVGFGKVETKQNPVEIVAESITNVLKALRKPAAAAVVVVVALLLVYDPKFALAASGGRMGGSSFSSSSGSSSSSSSSCGSCSSSWSSSGRSFSSSRSSNLTIEEEEKPLTAMIVLAAICLAIGFWCACFQGTEETSVIKLQIGLLGLAWSLQKDLNQIAETADTSTTKGLHHVLTETVVALLRHPDYFNCAYSSVDLKRSMEEGENRFSCLSIEERGKFDEETLVNVNNVRKQSSSIQKTGGFNNEYIVITILLAARGVFKLPSIKNGKDLKKALQKLGSIPLNRTLAVEVLWTPQKEDDTLSKEELLEDYPLLQPF